MAQRTLCSEHRVSENVSLPNTNGEIQHNKNNNNYNRVPGGAGWVGKTRFQLSDLDTLKDGRTINHDINLVEIIEFVVLIVI